VKHLIIGDYAILMLRWSHKVLISLHNLVLFLNCLALLERVAVLLLLLDAATELLMLLRGRRVSFAGH